MVTDLRTIAAAALAASVIMPAAQLAGENAAREAEHTVRTSPEVVVSASRIEVPAEQIGTAATVLTRVQIEDSQTRIASDILRQVPGIAVNRSGPAGTLTQIRIRGAEANQIQVRIDGIEVSDPGSSNEFNFANLLAPDIERVTVLRGPQSALYGSDAMAGVIDIRTRRGEGPFSIQGFVEGGSFATATGGVRLGAGNQAHDYALSLTGLRSEGINISQFGSEKDGYRNLSASFVGAIRPSEAIEIDAALRYSRVRVDTDDADFAFPVTPTQGLVIDTDDETEGRFFYGRLGGTLGLVDDVLEQKLEVAFTDTKRESFSAGTRETRREGDRVKFGTQSHLSFKTPDFAGAEHKLVAGYEREEASFDKTEFGVSFARTVVEHGFIGEYRLGLWDRLFLSGAVRRDKNEFFDNATTWRATAAVLVPEINARLHASYGTGVTDPTFDDLFGFNPGTFVGNPSLQPETSKSYDFGVEISLAEDRWVLDVTYFNADLENEIVSTFDPVTFLSSVANLAADSKRQGLEVSLTARPMQGLSLTGSYSYTLSEDGSGSQEIRRPRHVASLNGAYRFLQDRALVNLGIDYNGAQLDNRFFAAMAPMRVTLQSYTLVNLSGSYAVSDGVELIARIENALDQDYEEVFSFQRPGIAGFLGVRAKLWPN